MVCLVVIIVPVTKSGLLRVSGRNDYSTHYIGTISGTLKYSKPIGTGQGSSDNLYFPIHPRDSSGAG